MNGAERTVQIRTDSDVMAVRQTGRDMAREMGFGLADQSRLATAISELGRNVVQYAGCGVCILRDESDQSMIRIRVVMEDEGPGIADIEKAITNGFSTAQGLESGLPATKRLVDEFDVQSEPGHTKVTILIACGKQ